jgi:hypothetical protein
MMRPGQPDPNEFELAILLTLAEKFPSLRELTPKLRVLSREFKEPVSTLSSSATVPHPISTVSASVLQR